MSEIKENDGTEKRVNKNMAFPILNQATIAGVLMGDPPLRQTRRGVPVTNFVIKTTPEQSTIASPEGWEREPCYVSVVVWAQQAVNCNRYLKKGSPVLIIGELQSMPNAAPESGFFPVQINAQWIQYLDRGENATSMEDETEAASASFGEEKK
ncbi:single-stranded DNA-binding protein [candidate division KSB1 bacterium]|nr:single-stranded DNA-binding protein [candidate division KSB1 bacterium]